MTPAWICRSWSPPQQGAMPPAPQLLCLPSIICHFFPPHTLWSLHRNCISWGRSLKATFLTGFCIFSFRLMAFIQWLSTVDILNSAVQAIICHTEIELDKMTDWLLLVCFGTAVRIKSTQHIGSQAGQFRQAVGPDWMIPWRASRTSVSSICCLATILPDVLHQSQF